ncbi:LOW QUALITY PROTEIN: DNase I-like protein [Testicularia cyperi]|uniref:DNase I-like protein n=1 Tax=Testicularia cyperi TaxID=1882483 RepID=A0A317XGI8_9BASI|nr:LOW QUALITY PROTEIN: DNase I-like protein [Testicularia cyperi]
MSDHTAGQEPDEFGALSGGVSNLRSRFEQMSKSESSRPSSSSGAPNHVGAPKGIHPASAAIPPSPEPTSVASNGSDTSTTSHMGSLAASASAQASPSLTVLSTASSANSSFTELPKLVNASAEKSHAKKLSEHRSPNMPACKLGEPVPTLRPTKSYAGRDSNVSAPASASASASVSAVHSAATSDVEGPAVAKIPPPRPPKPAATNHGADLERLKHEGSTSRVTSLANMFSGSSRAPGQSSSTLTPGRISTSQHFLKHSRSNEQLSPTVSGSRDDNPFKDDGPPVSDASNDSFLRLPGTMAAIALSGGGDDAGISPEQLAAASAPAATAAPPPLPSRGASGLKGVDYQTEFRRRSLSASRSVGSLPVFHPLNAGDDADIPPLPARKPSNAGILTNEADSSVSTPSSAVLPPPQRSVPSSTVSSMHRAHTIGSRTRPIPVPTLPPRDTTGSTSASDRNGTLQPPPTRTVHHGFPFGRSFASSSHASSRNHTDSSDEDDEGDLAASISPPSSLKTPLGMRRPHPAAEMTPGGLPDTSHANRRAPTFNPDCSTSARQAFQCFALCGHTVVTGSADKVKVYRVGESASGSGEKLCTVGEHLSKEVKLTALEFRPPNLGIAPVSTAGKRCHGETADEGRYLWCGTKDGHIWELDVAEAQVVFSRQNVHTAAIQLLKRVGNKMLSLDEGGKISIWLPSTDPDPAVAGLRLSNQPITQRIALEKGSYACVLGQQLWVSTGPSAQRNAKDYAGSKGPRIRIYNPFADDKPFNATSKAVQIPAEMAEGVGMVTGGALIPSRPDFAYFGHDSGHVSIWSRQTYECVGVRKLGPHGLTAVAGVIKYLWVATRAGSIAVYDTESTPWQALKIWSAHREPITAIKVDEHGIEKVGRLQVASGGLDSAVRLWDGTLSYDWLQFEQSKRESEFCTYRSIKTLNVTFNIDAASPSDLESSAENMEVFPAMLRNALQVGSDGLPAERPPDVIVFGFQELIDLESKKLTAKSLLLGGGKKKANDLGDRVSRQYRAWYDKLIQIVRFAMPATCGYLLVQSESLVGLFTCVFVKQSEFKHVRELAISTVKTGMGGRYGNKGAVIARMVLQDTSLVFVNSHLAAGQKHVKQRNADIADILEYPTVFEDAHADPAAYVGGGDGSMILDHEACFWSGDLNYRIDHSRETVLSAIYAKKFPVLLEQDQLRKELKQNPAFRLKNFSEAAISFLPTYKYDRGTHEWDSSEKNRIPAWCDRVLFKSHHPDRIKCLDYRRWETTISDHRPVTAVFEVKIKAADPAKRTILQGQLKQRWSQLEQGILANAVRFYTDPQ